MTSAGRWSSVNSRTLKPRMTPSSGRGKTRQTIGLAGRRGKVYLPSVESYRKGNDITIPLSPGAGHVHGGVERKGGAQRSDGFPEITPGDRCPRPGCSEADFGYHIVIGGTEGDEVGIQASAGKRETSDPSIQSYQHTPESPHTESHRLSPGQIRSELPLRNHLPTRSRGLPLHCRSSKR